MLCAEEQRQKISYFGIEVSPDKNSEAGQITVIIHSNTVLFNLGRGKLVRGGRGEGGGHAEKITTFFLDTLHNYTQSPSIFLFICFCFVLFCFSVAAPWHVGS